ncbi:hypothetical protein P2G67_09180 [Fodinicurvata sp. CAU 1616]|uniref:Sulfotransferase domain-containing protein n=1 Tax=Aquibaculum arenosum TaxID=3032591 RepID=A0ABT5YMT2_9PROT|nr:hypothetical protein [Fodinicurvata sp. CAU 1616]
MHIGTEKTGTTALQRTLFKNKNAMLDNGWLYYHDANLFNAREVAAACVGDNNADAYLRRNGIRTLKDRLFFRQRVISHLEKQLFHAPSHIHTIVVSSEHFHSRLVNQESIAQLKTFFGQYANSFFVVVYLRRQVDLATSMYSTRLKSGAHEQFHPYVEKLLAEKNHYCNYDIFLKKWETLFDRDCMRVRIFDRVELIKSNIVNDFFSVCGYTGTWKPTKINFNESLTPLGQLLLRQANIKHLALREHADAESWKHMRKMIVAHFSGKGRQLPAAKANALQSRFIQSNEAVRARWFPDRKELFSSHFLDNESEITPEQDQVVDIVYKYLNN